MLSGSFERSVSSGTEVCIRNAISYCAIRVEISGSPNSSGSLVQLAQRIEKLPPVLAASKPGGFERYSTGSPTERNFTPW